MVFMLSIHVYFIYFIQYLILIQKAGVFAIKQATIDPSLCCSLNIITGESEENNNFNLRTFHGYLWM